MPVNLCAGVVIEPPRAVGQARGVAVGEEDPVFHTKLPEGTTKKAAVGEGTKVKRGFVLAKAHKAEAGQRIFHIHAHEQEAFVVGEVRVVARFPLFDKLAFEEKGFAFGFHHEVVKIVDEIGASRGPWAVAPIFLREAWK